MGMPTSSTADPSSATPAAKASEPPANKRPLPQAAARALAEAEARRTERERGKAETQASQPTTEVGGRGGLDPTRYGDWEVNGLASDF
jgi:hypothetical protein